MQKVAEDGVDGIDRYESAVVSPSSHKMALYWSRRDVSKYPHMSWKKGDL